MKAFTYAKLLAFSPSLVFAQEYGGSPNYTIGETETVYDGIGTVTEMPGGTSILERVLYAVEKLKLGSSESMVPVNGIYANIAESVRNRQWYSSSRTEVAYEDYSENVTTTTVQSTPLSYSDLTGADPILTFADPTGSTSSEYGLSDVVYANITIYSWSKGSNRPELATDFTPSGTLSLSLDQLGSVFDMENSNLDNYFEVRENGDIYFTQSLNYLDVYEYAIFIEIGGEVFHYDTVNSAEDSGTLYDGSAGYTISSGPYVGTYKAEEDILGLNEFIDGPMNFEISSMNVYWSNGSAKLATADQFAANLDGFSPVVFEQSIEETTTEYLTRQLDSFYVDWTQREVSTMIDGSVINVINGVSEATDRAATAAGTAVSFTAPDINIGDIATTTLGAVNTGEIVVGVNSAVDDASASTTRAISASLTVVGGSAETGAMMLNIAHNSSIIRGNVDNTLTAVNGSVGDISTTALGAVNTGSIANGVNAAVQGIAGMSVVN